MKWNPAYKITVAGSQLESGSAGLLSSLEVRSHVSEGADEARIFMDLNSDFTPQEGDEISIELGWQDGPEMKKVFTGFVQGSMVIGAKRELSSLGKTIHLIEYSGSKTFVSQKASEIVQALCDEAGLSLNQKQDGITLPTFLVTPEKSYFEHCCQLAQLSGFDFYTNGEGKINFTAYKESAPQHNFIHGVDILDVQVQTSLPLQGVVQVPESPSSSQGDDASSWLSKSVDSHTGKAGQQNQKRYLILKDPVLRTKEAAEVAANAHLMFSMRDSLQGSLLCMGYSDIGVGQTISIEDTPRKEANGSFQVTGYRHLLDKHGGFKTQIFFGRPA